MLTATRGVNMMGLNKSKQQRDQVRTNEVELRQRSATTKQDGVIHVRLS